MSHLLRQPLILISFTAIGLITWNWSVDGEAGAQTPTAHKQVSPRHSTIKTRAARQAELLAQSQPANIDANARILALYERFPELAVKQHVLDLNIDKKLQEIFKGDGRDPPTYEMKQMLLWPLPNDSTSEYGLQIKETLKSYEAMISQILRFVNSQPDLRLTENYHVGSMHYFLTNGYEYSLKNGNLDRAASIYGALSNLTQSTRDLDNFNHRDSIDSIDRIAQLHLEHFTSNPGFISNLLPLYYRPPLNSATLRNSFPHLMERIYGSTSLDPSGNDILDYTDPFADDSIELGDKLTIKAMPIEAAEEIMVKLTLDLLHHAQSLEGNNLDSQQNQIKAPLPRFWIKDDRFTYAEQRLAEISGLSNFTFLTDSNSDSEVLAKAYNTAFQIACAQYKGHEWSEKLPIDHKTGKPIIWDKEKNLLETGLKEDNAIIKIPVIK